MDPQLKLTENFTLGEFTRSETAQRFGIKNEPDADQLDNLRYNAEHMEMVRDLLGCPIHISSGLRVVEINRKIGSKDTSDHVKGLATDFEAPQFGSPLTICRAIEASNLPFKQLIFEHTWVHISWDPEADRPKREVLTLMPGVTYARGIVV